MEMANDMDQTGATPEALLAELSELRASTRSRRRAYWLPLLVFGLLICASAPQYVRSDVATDSTFTTGSSWLTALGGWAFATAGSDVRGLYWLFAVLAGAATTALWYGWHARLTGVGTRVRGSVLAWVLGATLLTVLS